MINTKFYAEQIEKFTPAQIEAEEIRCNKHKEENPARSLSFTTAFFSLHIVMMTSSFAFIGIS